MSAERKSCATCKFCGTIMGGDKTLLTICRRRPPVVTLNFIPVGGGLRAMENTIWPQVNDSQWCGEYELNIVVN